MAVKKRLGEMLVEAGIIDETQLHAALGHQRQWGGRLGAILVELKLASEEAIVDALALKFGFEIARLDRIEPYAFEQAKALVPRDYAARNHVFPLSADTGVLVVAMSDPTNLALTDELAFRSGRRVKVCIAGENAIQAAIRAHLGDEGHGSREAIALDAEDDTAMEAVYDPIGATSSEQLSHIYDQPPAAAPARAAPAAKPAAKTVAAAPAQPKGAARPAATQADRPRSAEPKPSTQVTLAAQAVQPATRAAPAKAAVAPPPAEAPPAPVPPPAAPAPFDARSRPRNPSVLQLEDQPTGSIPLEPGAELTEEELQPLEGEPLPEPDLHHAVVPMPGPDHAAEAYAEVSYTEPGHVEPAHPDQAAWTDPAQADAGHAAASLAQPAWGEGAHAEAPPQEAPPRELTTEEAMILEAIGQLARGDDASAQLVRPAQLVAALIRLMLRKQWITERELLDEILHG